MRLYIRHTPFKNHIILYDDNFAPVVKAWYAGGRVYAQIGNVKAECTLDEHRTRSGLLELPILGSAWIDNSEEIYNVFVKHAEISILSEAGDVGAKLHIYPIAVQDIWPGKALAVANDSCNHRITIKHPKVLDTLAVWLGKPLLYGEGTYSPKCHCLHLCVLLLEIYVDPIGPSEGA